MHPNSGHPHRRSIRLPGYDYTRYGAYFVTVVTHGRRHVFGHISDKEMHLSQLGEIANTHLCTLAAHFAGAYADEWVVMPNHAHCIIAITDRPVATAEEREERFGKPVRHSLATIVRSYKASVTRLGRPLMKGDSPLWQRNYYEHIIRNDEALERIRNYIERNPARWAEGNIHRHNR